MSESEATSSVRLFVHYLDAYLSQTEVPTVRFWLVPGYSSLLRPQQLR